MDGPKSDVEFKIGDARSEIELGSAWQALSIDQTKRLEALVNKLLPVVQEELAYRTGYQHEDRHVAWSLANGLLAVPELLAFVTGKPDASTNTDEEKSTRGCSSRWAYERYLMAYADDLVGGSARHRDENERVAELAAKAVASCDQHSGYVRSYKSFVKEVERLFDTADEASRCPTCGPVSAKEGCERCGDKVAHAFTDQGKVGADGLRCVTPEPEASPNAVFPAHAPSPDQGGKTPPSEVGSDAWQYERYLAAFEELPYARGDRRGLVRVACKIAYESRDRGAATPLSFADFVVERDALVAKVGERFGLDEAGVETSFGW